MSRVKVVVAVVVVVILGYLFFVNRAPVKFSFGPAGQIEISKTLLIVISAALGSAVTLLAQWTWKRSRRSGTGL